MTTFNRALSLKTLAAVLLVVGAASAAWTVQGKKSASFKAVGPGGLSIVGNGSDVAVKDKDDTVAISVGLDSLKTGIDLRDRHMKEKYLETNKYPSAVLQVDKAKLKVPTPGTDIEGKLNLHGVTRTVRVHYSANGSNNKATVAGTVHVNMKEFGINVPSYLGVTVKPDVDVSVQFDATDG